MSVYTGSMPRKTVQRRASARVEWPDWVAVIVRDAALEYGRQMNGMWPVPDVLMAQAIEYVNDEMDRFMYRNNQAVGTPEFWDLWESGNFDQVVQREIDAFYRTQQTALHSMGPRRR
jgi:hypothetical protein